MLVRGGLVLGRSGLRVFLASTAIVTVASGSAIAQSAAPAAGASTAQVEDAASTADPTAPTTQAGSQSALGDIIVTARRREESLQNVPGAVVALSASDLADAGVRRPQDIQNLVPGLVFKNFGLGLPVISLRGSGNRVGAQPSVGVFQDGIFLTPTQIARGAVDIQRVEVAKGPQSTLYGRATMAGAINFVTADPTTRSEGSVEAGIGGSSSFGESLYHFRAIASGPLIGDNLLGRIVIAKEQRDGYLFDPVQNWRGQGYDRTFVRGKLVWNATPDVTTKLTVEFLEDNPTLGAAFFNNPPPSNRVPFAPQTGPNAFNYALNPLDFGESIFDTRFTEEPFGRLTDTNITLETDWDTPIGTVTSLTNYSRSRQIGNNDGDMTQYPLVRFLYPANGRRFNQELRLTGGDRLKYLAGLYYLRGKIYTGTSLTYGPGSTNFIAGQRVQFQPQFQDLKSYAAFFNIGYDITDRLNVTGGLRQGRDDIFQDNTIVLTAISGAETTFGPFRRSVRFDQTEGNAVVTYKIRPDVLVYTSYARGSRPGGLNTGTSAAVANLPFSPEKVDSYEVGFKGTLLDERLRANATLFYSRYSDLQVGRNQAVNGLVVNTTANAASARSKGLDFDGAVVISSQFRLTAGYTYNDAKITRFELTQGTPVTQDLSGQPIIRSPRHSGNVGAKFTAPIGPGKLDLGANFYFTSSYANDYSVPATVGLPIQTATTRPYQTLGLNAAYALGDWELSAYVNNVFNEQYLAGASLNFYNQLPFGLPGEPRTFEVTLKRSF